MNITLSVTELVAILGFSLSVAVAFATVLWTIWRRAESNHKNVMDRLNELEKDVTSGDASLAKSLSDFQLIVAQQYATWSQISDMERKWLQETERLHSAIGGLTSRIDRILTRLDKNGEL